MKHLVTSLASAAMCFAVSSPILAQGGAQLQAVNYDSYYIAQDENPTQSPSDVVPVDPPQEAAPIASYGGCGNGCGSCNDCCDSCCSSCDRCDFGEPMRAFPTFCNGLNFGGWVNGGFVQNGRGSRVTNNFPVQFSDREGFNINQMWGFVDKPLNTDGGFDWGFRMDYVYGTDALDTQAFGDGGWDFGWNSSSQYGSAIPQLYAEAGFGDVSVKAGHFFTIIGYEVVQAPQNFFYTHALTMVYGEPFTHTGVVASTPVGEYITVTGGWTSGWDSGWENRNDASTFLGGIGVTLTEDLSVNWACNAGDFGNGMGDIYMNSFVVQASLTDRLSYVLQHDYAVNSGLTGGDAEWYGINQYAFYEINGCLSLGGRIEWFRDDDGVRILNPNGMGTAGDYWECTIGANLRAHSNFIVRPELRWDWFDGVGTPFANGTQDSIFTAGADFILTF